jgi:peptidoglycan/LPS O-acetylase OafA/YrhL
LRAIPDVASHQSRAGQDEAPARYTGESGIVGAVHPSARDSRVAALDGLRGLAILLVIAHNAGSAIGPLDGIVLKLWAVISNAGWAGVQLFFALSGFLITRILLNAKGGPGLMRSFYARRVLRIVPLYYVVLAFTFFVAPHIHALHAIASSGDRSQFWYWTYLSNWVSPFGTASHGLPHVWSLAVEEQFYLIWPLLVVLSSKRVLGWICFFMVISALIARVALHIILPPEVVSSAAYEFTITRWDGIALGGLVALVMSKPRIVTMIRPYLWPAMIAMTLALLVALLVQHGLPAQGPVPELVNLPLTALLSALVVLACVSDNGGNGQHSGRPSLLVRFFSARWLTWIGTYSYAIYVFHMPIHLLLAPLVEGRLAQGSANVRFALLLGYVVLVFTLSSLLALLSWHVLEQPMLGLKRYFPMPVGRARAE